MKIENVNKDSLKILFCCDIIILETKRRHFDVSHVHTAPLHMLFPPPLFHFINAYKSASSRLLKKEFPQIRQKLWKECFWSQSFCLLTTGGAPIEVIKKYIESQGEKH